MGFLGSVGRAFARNAPKLKNIFKGQTAANIYKGVKGGAMSIAKGVKAATQRATQVAKTAIRKIKNIFKKKKGGYKEEVISKGGPAPKRPNNFNNAREIGGGQTKLDPGGGGFRPKAPRNPMPRNTAGPSRYTADGYVGGPYRM